MVTLTCTILLLETDNAIFLAASQWSVWVASIPEQQSPQIPHHRQTPNHPHKLPSVLTCEPQPLLLLVPVHNTHPRNLFYYYVSDCSSKSRHPDLKVTNEQKAQPFHTSTWPHSADAMLHVSAVVNLGSGYIYGLPSNETLHISLIYLQKVKLFDQMFQLRLSESGYCY